MSYVSHLYVNLPSRSCKSSALGTSRAKSSLRAPRTQRPQPHAQSRSRLASGRSHCAEASVVSTWTTRSLPTALEKRSSHLLVPFSYPFLDLKEGIKVDKSGFALAYVTSNRVNSSRDHCRRATPAK